MPIDICAAGELKWLWASEDARMASGRAPVAHVRNCRARRGGGFAEHHMARKLLSGSAGRGRRHNRPLRAEQSERAEQDHRSQLISSERDHAASRVVAGPRSPAPACAAFCPRVPHLRFPQLSLWRRCALATNVGFNRMSWPLHAWRHGIAVFRPLVAAARARRRGFRIHGFECSPCWLKGKGVA